MKPDVTIVAERTPVVLEKRRPLTRAEFAQILLNQNGRCGCGCGAKLQPMTEKVVDEHRVALALGGTNDLSNRELWRAPCSVAKTAGKDAPAIAKAKRLAGETCTGPKREIPTHVNAWGPKGGRGFSARTRKFDGSTGPTKKAARAAREKDHG